jgi:membrane-associated protein
VKPNIKQFIRLFFILVALGAVAYLDTRDFDLEAILRTGGVLAVGSIVFAETGLLVGFFLPGDTLLFATGFFAAQGKIGLVASILAMFIGAVLGNMMGYEIGKRSGPKVFKKQEGLFFHKDNVEKAQAFYNKHGGKTVLFARFIPIVRTLAPLIAGIGKMDYRRFMFYTITGAFIWVVTVTMVGYWAGRVLGQYFDIEHYLLPLILLATLLTFGGSFLHLIKDEANRKKLKASSKNYFKSFFKN